MRNVPRSTQGHYFNVLCKDKGDVKGLAGTSRFSRRGLLGFKGTDRAAEEQQQLRVRFDKCVQPQPERGSSAAQQATQALPALFFTAALRLQKCMGGT